MKQDEWLMDLKSWMPIKRMQNDERDQLEGLRCHALLMTMHKGNALCQ